jgi:signal transduction histidine kinase
MSNDSMPLVALLRRSFRTSVVPFVVGLIILAAAYSGWEGYNDAQRTTELVASHAIAVTAAGINSQDLLSVQREIKRFGDVLRDGGYARMTADISIDGAIIAQIRPSSGVRPPTIDLVRRSRLPNGKELIVTVETSLWGSVWRWALISLAVSLAGIGMMMASDVTHRLIVHRVVDPILAAVRQVAKIASRVDEATAEDLDVPRSAVAEVEDMVVAVRCLVSALERHRHDAAAATEALVDRERENAHNEAVARLTQVLAHDARKPMSHLKIMLSMLARESDPQRFRTAVGRYVDRVEESMARFDALVRDVLDSGASLVLDTREMGLLDLVISARYAATTAEGVTFRFTIDSVARVKVDDQRILRVLGNILDNAIQAMQARGDITFTARSTCNGMTMLGVSNSGTFIPREDLDKLFTPFFTKGKRNGTGLGLAIAERIVHAHGGTIWCESDASIGTTFWMTLPSVLSEEGAESGAARTASSV